MKHKSLIQRRLKLNSINFPKNKKLAGISISFLIILLTGTLSGLQAQEHQTPKPKGTITILDGNKQREISFYFDSLFNVPKGDVNMAMEKISDALDKVNFDSLTQEIFIENNGDENKQVIIIRNDDMLTDGNMYVHTNDQLGKDTVVIRLGNKIMKIVDDDKTKIELENAGKGKSKNKIEFSVRKKHRFEGHWNGVDLGVNSFYNPDFSAYGNDNFMALNNQKSVEFNLNMFQVDIGLFNSSYIGLVSGIGFTWNNYVFDNDITIAKDNNTNRIEKIDLTGDVKKTKMRANYINLPLLLEFQIPAGSERIFVNGGGIFGVNIDSHTFYKIGEKKTKNNETFYLNPIRYGFTGRVGYGNMAVYANYYMSEFFQNDKGPELYPLTVGLSFCFATNND